MRTTSSPLRRSSAACQRECGSPWRAGWGVAPSGPCRPPLQHGELGAFGGLGDFDPGVESFFELVDVGDDQDELEVFGDGLDGIDQALAAFGVLGAEAFVDDEGLEAGPGAAGEELG